MPTQYKAPVEDYLFVLHDVLKSETAHSLGEMSREDSRAVLEQAARFFEEKWAPLDAVGDEHGCRFDNGAVTTPPGYKEGYASMCEAGWHSVSAPEESGGAGLPDLIGQAVHEFSSSACNALGLYSGLTNAAHATVHRTGHEWMRRHVVPRMVDGRWSGTMCLTEPHCGTDLRLMKTRALPGPDGTWKLTGTKIFISGGEHDLAENVVHLVLAKVPDEHGRIADDLSKVSLFLVSKLSIDPDTGALGERNGVIAAGIEHKMGLKGSATCTMAFEDAVAYRLGESRSATGQQRKSSAGMSGMFDMMNSARLGTGLQALASANRAYGHAAQYARERLAGRAAKEEHRTGATADPLIVHPDVRRLLLRQASFIEGGRALALYVRTLLDHSGEIGGVPRTLIGGFLTPVIKAFFSDRSFESANDAMQLMGGHGYIHDNGVEQLVRDSRIFQLYEGANGVQAFDLAARKLPSAGGKVLSAFLALVATAANEVGQIERLSGDAESLRAACHQLEVAGTWLMKDGRDPYDIGGASYDFLEMVGIVAVGLMWLRTAQVADAMVSQGDNSSFLHRKMVLARYWFERELPAVQALGVRVEKGATSLMDLPAELF
jgi:alkylation response protein AidB-like acyl-CoA dehydrogenase